MLRRRVSSLAPRRLAVLAVLAGRGPAAPTGASIAAALTGRRDFSRGSTELLRRPAGDDDVLEVELEGDSGAPSGSGGAGEGDVEVEIMDTPENTELMTHRVEESVTEDVAAPDAFARARVSNCLKRVDPKWAGFVFEEAEAAGPEGATGWFCAKFHVPLPAKPEFADLTERKVFAEGIAATKQDAQLAAFLHAERIVDALGITLFAMSSKQQKHAEAVAAAGRYAPFPGDEARPDAPIPLPVRIYVDPKKAERDRTRLAQRSGNQGSRNDYRGEERVLGAVQRAKKLAKIEDRQRHWQKKKEQASAAGIDTSEWASPMGEEEIMPPMPAKRTEVATSIPAPPSQAEAIRPKPGHEAGGGMGAGDAANLKASQQVYKSERGGHDDEEEDGSNFSINSGDAPIETDPPPDLSQGPVPVESLPLAKLVDLMTRRLPPSVCHSKGDRRRLEAQSGDLNGRRIVRGRVEQAGSIAVARFDETERGKWQLANTVSMRDSFPNCVQTVTSLDREAVSRVEKYLQTHGRTLDKDVTVVEGAYGGLPYVEAIIELPPVVVPARVKGWLAAFPYQTGQIVRPEDEAHATGGLEAQASASDGALAMEQPITFVARGRAATVAVATQLAVQHAEVLIDYSGAMLCPEAQAQLAHAHAAWLAGRLCVWDVERTHAFLLRENPGALNKDFDARRIRETMNDNELLANFTDAGQARPHLRHLGREPAPVKPPIPLKEISPFLSEFMYRPQRAAPLSAEEFFTVAHQEVERRGTEFEVDIGPSRDQWINRRRGGASSMQTMHVGSAAAEARRKERDEERFGVLPVEVEGLIPGWNSLAEVQLAVAMRQYRQSMRPLYLSCGAESQDGRRSSIIIRTEPPTGGVGPEGPTDMGSNAQLSNIASSWSKGLLGCLGIGPDGRETSDAVAIVHAIESMGMMGVSLFGNPVKMEKDPRQIELEKMRKACGLLTGSGATADAIKSITKRKMKRTQKVDFEDVKVPFPSIRGIRGGRRFPFLPNMTDVGLIIEAPVEEFQFIDTRNSARLVDHGFRVALLKFFRRVEAVTVRGIERTIRRHGARAVAADAKVTSEGEAASTGEAQGFAAGHKVAGFPGKDETFHVTRVPSALSPRDQAALRYYCMNTTKGHMRVTTWFDLPLRMERLEEVTANQGVHAPLARVRPKRIEEGKVIAQGRASKSRDAEDLAIVHAILLLNLFKVTPFERKLEHDKHADALRKYFPHLDVAPFEQCVGADQCGWPLTVESPRFWEIDRFKKDDANKPAASDGALVTAQTLATDQAQKYLRDLRSVDRPYTHSFLPDCPPLASVELRDKLEKIVGGPIDGREVQNEGGRGGNRKQKHEPLQTQSYTRSGGQMIPEAPDAPKKPLQGIPPEKQRPGVRVPPGQKRGLNIG